MAFPDHMLKLGVYGQLMNLIYYNQQKDRNLTANLLIEIFEIFDEDEFAAQCALAYLVQKNIVLENDLHELRLNEEKLYKFKIFKKMRGGGLHV